jgi:predicted nucleic acid-binding Zn ribbon protein
MEITEGVTEHQRCSVCARGISGYSTTFLQTCRKRSDELLGEQSRVAEGTDNIVMGSSRRSEATAMNRSHATTNRLGGFGEDVSIKARGEWAQGI